jgi:hypothetical protein
MLRRIFIVLAILIIPITSQATLIDFTDRSWSIVNGTNMATLGDVTLTSSGGYMTFNGSSSERSGCNSAGAGLACAGDGVGIGDDEITQSSREAITVSFASPVDITNIYLLDLFGNENRGEKAVIDSSVLNSAGTDNSLLGGFFVTNYTDLGVTSLVFSGYQDTFSDYALAAIEVSTVPLPGAIFLFGTALLGFMGFRRNS